MQLIKYFKRQELVGFFMILISLQQKIKENATPAALSLIKGN